MLIQEIIYLGFVVYGVISLLLTMAYISLKLDDKRLREKKKDLYDVTDFESRLKEGKFLTGVTCSQVHIILMLLQMMETLSA